MRSLPRSLLALTLACLLTIDCVTAIASPLPQATVRERRLHEEVAGIAPGSLVEVRTTNKEKLKGRLALLRAKASP